MSRIRNIALFAHVDAGKTSVTEQFLFLAGKIKTIGSVDKGNSQTDSLEVEKKRGITVNSTVLTFNWKETVINLIDTPGHIDFSSETEKAILAIDSAVIIISALEGVQAQTENIVNLLLKHKKPFVIFVNKIDRLGADIERVEHEIINELNVKPFLLQTVVDEGTDDASSELVWSAEKYTQEELLIENIVEENDALFEQFLEGNIPSFIELEKELKKSILKQTLIPVMLGSAKYAKGIEFLLNSIVDYLPEPECASEELSAVVFKTYHIKGVGKMSAVRIFSGEINSRISIINSTKGIEEKVSLIKDTDILNQKIIQKFSAGEIAWVQGLKYAEPGDFFGVKISTEYKDEKKVSLLIVQLVPTNESETNDLIEALNILNNEDPDLKFEYQKDEQEFYINIRGDIQKEIIQYILKSRFGIEVEFSKPTVIYKETPTIECEGYVRYWMPKPCWAIMKFKIEPGESGSGVKYSSLVSVNDVKNQYQNDVRKTIPTALKQGVLGWQVDDIIISLIEGEDHEAHTKSNDFAIATPMGIMDGLSKSESTLLEPILSFKIIAPEENLGSLISELLKLRAEFESPLIESSKCIINGKIPLATSIDFPIKLSSLTSGKGKIRTEFDKYQQCDVNLGEIRKFKGISPLDTAKYILKARKALI